MTTLNRRPTSLRGVADLLVAVFALALLTWGAYRLDARPTTAALLYLALVILVSLRGSLGGAILLSIAATLSLNYFFLAPGPAFLPTAARDVVALAVFSVAAIVVTRLVTALRTSEGRWRNVFENNPTMYFMVDDSGTVLSVNPTGAKQLGYTPDELVGRPVLDVFVEQDKAAAGEHLARCLAHVGESMSWELRKVRKDGSMLWVRETARAVQLGNDAPVVLIACEDITDRNATQDKLHENEAHLRGQASLLDLTHDAIFVRDLSDCIAYWNRGAELLYGWTKAEALGRVTHELLRTDFPEPLDEIIATVLRSGRWEGELAHTKRDGTRVVVASRWSVQRDEQGNPTGILETNNDITERKRAEEELRRSQAYLAEAQRLTHTGSWAVDYLTGKLVYWSEETFRICGRDPKRGLPNSEETSRLAHPEDSERLAKLVGEAFREKADFVADYRLVLDDGTLRYVQLIGHPALDKNGEPVEYVGTMVDVTSRKRAEDERQAHLWFLESMDRVNRALHGANDPEQMMSEALDVTLSIFDCDQVWLAYPCDPATPSWRVVMARTRPEYPAAFAQGSEGIPVREETVRIFRAARGSTGPIRLGVGTGLPLSDEMRRETGMQSVLAMALYPKVGAPYLFGLSQNSHARTWTEPEERLFQEIGRRLADALTTLLVLRDLRESAQRYRNIFQMAEVSIWEENFSQIKGAIEKLRARGVRDFRRYFAEHPEFVAQAAQMVRIVDVNDATLRLFAAASKDELLISLEKVFTPETLDVFAGELLAIAEGRTSFAAETTLKTLEGERLDILFTIAFPPEPTRYESVLVSIMDVTARKRAEEALRRVHAELSRANTLTTMGQFAASIAHELRQPLAAIAMNGSATLRWLNRESPDLGEAREAASRIVREAQRADEVIRGLRALMGQSELQRAMVDTNEVVHEVLELARGELRRNGVSVQTELDTTLPGVLADRVQLQQVLLNLIVNAIEAMAPVADRPKALMIRTARAGTTDVAITVEDSGPGLDPATAGRIFDPFFTTKPNGLGMGLSISRSIVETNGGQLSASAGSPHGTIFRFTIPTASEVGVEDAPSTTVGAA